MSEHTPGPWHFRTKKDDRIGCFTNEIRVYAGTKKERGSDWLADCGPIHDKVRIDNARLIAAAPDMLNALESAEKYFVDSGHPDYDPEECEHLSGDGWCSGCTLVEIRAAISKARGGK